MRVDKSGITLHSPLLSKQGYFIPWAEVRNLNDVDRWLRQLDEKDWCTDAMRLEFRRACAFRLAQIG